MTQAAQMPEWMRERLAGTTAAPGEVEIAPDEVSPFALFVALGTQWRWCAMSGHRLGLDYSAVAATADMQGTPITPALFRDLRLMEAAAMEAWNQARRK